MICMYHSCTSFEGASRGGQPLNIFTWFIAAGGKKQTIYVGHVKVVTYTGILCIKQTSRISIAVSTRMIFAWHQQRSGCSRLCLVYCQKDTDSLMATKEIINIANTQITLDEETGWTLRSISNQSSEPCGMAQYLYQKQQSLDGNNKLTHAHREKKGMGSAFLYCPQCNLEMRITYQAI